MKFETGKFYRTHDGRKAQIFMLDNGMDMMLGAVYIVSKEHNLSRWANVTWYKSGVVSQDDNEGQLDLVSEWREPRKISTEVWISPIEVVADSNALVLRMGFNSYDVKKYGSCTVKARITVEEIPDDAT